MRSDFSGLVGWTKNSFIDYPEFVSTVLFFSGCNLRCPWCHNGDLALGVAPKQVESADIWDFLERRKGLIDAVVFTGGEPTLHESLVSTIPDIRELGYKVKLDTNGLLPQVIDLFNPDYLAMDVKTVPDRYPKILGAKYDDIESRLLQSLERIKDMGENSEVRITVAPRTIDDDVIKSFCEMLKGVHNVILQPMNQKTSLLDPSWNTIKLIPDEDIKRFRNILSDVVESCTIRGE